MYRTPAKCRCRQVGEWAKWLATECILSAMPGAGAHCGHDDLAIHIEHALCTGIEFAGSCTDLKKSFDTLPREIIIPVALTAGFPIKILEAYIAFIDQITSYPDYALGLGKPMDRPAPIPQGCHFSMTFLVPPIAPWAVLMLVQEAIPRARADDLTTITICENAMVSTVAVLRGACEFLNATGGKGPNTEDMGLCIMHAYSVTACTRQIQRST